MSLELHIGQMNKISMLSSPILTSATLLRGSQVLPLDSSERLEVIGHILYMLFTEESDLKGGCDIMKAPLSRPAEVLSSQYRLVCFSPSKVNALSENIVLAEPDAARTFWFNQDPELNNSGYTPIWGYDKDNAPVGLGEVKLLRPEKETGGFFSIPRIYLRIEHDNMSSKSTGGAVFVLSGQKREIETIYQKMIRAYDNQQPVSYPQLGNYYSQDSNLKAELADSPTPETMLKRFELVAR